jgi:peptidoglycan/LPS O-acetylase OafA/YrhL
VRWLAEARGRTALPPCFPAAEATCDAPFEHNRNSMHSYRSDVDGLRAVSIVLVLLFHVGSSLFKGGFVGVDVFFVISGYLITGIIFREIDNKRFSFLWFYERRARRILPALVTVILATSFAGYFLLYPDMYERFGNSALAALAGTSNFYFLHHTGYFDAPAQSMPLLHSWSLGVEEQFYLLWPLSMLLASRLCGRSDTVGSRCWR